LLLTWLADAAGRLLAPTLYTGYPSPWDLRLLASGPAFAFFLHESLSYGLRWLSNGPLWSIAYEFWYYVLYGIAVYFRGVARWLLLVLALAISGYKILLLSPLWLMGVMLYRRRNVVARLKSGTVAGLALVGMTSLFLLCSPTGYSALAKLRQIGVATFGANYSAYICWDLIIIVPVCMVMLATIHPLTAAPNEFFSRWIKLLAGGTFSIYCFHVPLLVLLTATGIYDDSLWPQALLAALFTVAVCLALSMVTERKKTPWLALWTKILRAREATDRHARYPSI
jgi:peptidoglycan/LPS O-acetylase OafA/YrhL